MPDKPSSPQLDAALIDDLRFVRQRDAQISAAEANLPFSLSLQERIRLFESLCRDGQRHIQATDTLFGPSRQRAMIVLQARLGRLADLERGKVGSDVPTGDRDSAPAPGA
jgi:hypothetical protein